MLNVYLAAFCLFNTGDLQVQKSTPDSLKGRIIAPIIDRGLLETARAISLKAPGKRVFKDTVFSGMLTSPVLPNLVVFVFGANYNAVLVDPPPRYLNYTCVGLDTLKKISKILDKNSFADFVDTAEATRINNETEALDYVKFILKTVYQKEILDDKTETSEQTRAYLKENLSEQGEDYLPKTRTTPDGYSVATYACKKMNVFHPLHIALSKYLFCINRNGVISDVWEKDSLPAFSEGLPAPVSEYDGVTSGKPVCFAECSITWRKSVEAPLPDFPEWLKNQRAFLKLRVTISPDGVITGNPAILVSTGYESLDYELIRWLKDKWRWEKIPSGETNGTITIKFSWIE